VATYLGVKTDPDALRKAAGTTKDGTTMEGLAKAAQSLGLKAEGIQTGRDALAHMQMPAIAWCGNHYIGVLEIKGGPGDAGTARIHDPNKANEETVTQEFLLRRSQGGYLLLVHR
jgi:ATP-binding cassette subfamily B protein